MFKRSWLISSAVALAPALMLAGCGGQNPQASSKSGKKGGGAGLAVSVAVSKVTTMDLPVYLSGLGSVEAFNTVAVKSRIDGQLVQINFREGQDVKKGDLLAVIDPRPYQVALAQAEATLYKDQSALKDAKLNMDRFAGLVKDGVIPQQQYDTQVSLVGQLEGAVRADQANADNQKLNLVYSQITAPVSGRIGLRQVDIGNIVHAADPNGMLVITQLQPIAVIFTLPEDNLPSVQQHMQKGTLQVEAYSRDDQTKLATGKLLTIDNQIDPTTGTAKLKAVFDNHEKSLWPNQFINAHLLLETRKNNVVVPTPAVQRGPQGAFVFTVKSDNTAEIRPVNVVYSQGNFTAVASGVNPGDLVVTDGQDKLQPGTPLVIRGGGGGQSPTPSADSGQ
ncbi:MAG TPA: efflux RND transporter periplasmic adaptor subunit [Candidatus Angelobacter sp.]|nr:efflux RND transporter periplasmic adaptor subunit [Candidatus Angelobacter sp.]